jgi:hypothetical protein
MAAGGVFYSNASIENDYRPRKASEQLAVDYERTWRRYETLPVPRVVGIALDVDLEPTAGRARVGSRFTLVNRLPTPIDTILVNVASDAPGLAASLDTLAFDRPFTIVKADTLFGVRLVRLATPLVAGDSLRVRTVQRLRVRGYPNGEPEQSLVGNGTFLNRDKFPTFFYAQQGELQSDELRRKYKLPLQRRGRSRTDPDALARQSFLADADLASFEAVVSTDPDQVAMAPGYLQREWVRRRCGGRSPSRCTTTPRTRSTCSGCLMRRRRRWRSFPRSSGPTSTGSCASSSSPATPGLRSRSPTRCRTPRRSGSWPGWTPPTSRTPTCRTS